MLNGQPQIPLGEQTLQNMGANKEAAALIYMGIGLVPAFTASTTAQYVANLGRFTANEIVPVTAKMAFPPGMVGGNSVVKPSTFAESLQGVGNYPGVDKFRDIILKQGTIVFGGVPGQSNFYTTASAIERAGGSAVTLFNGLQVSPHPLRGYRPGVTAYEVIYDIPAAFGRTLANPQHGTGRLPQIVIDGYQNVLSPIYSVPLK